ncbi:MAG: thiol peroxidase [Lentisphaeria bacterium]|jgi:thiol peroxidase
MDQPNAITFQGNPLTLTGNPVKVGMAAPDFTVLDGTLAPVTRAAFAGKVAVFLTVPSLDTPVCDLEIRTFNRKAASLGPAVELACISMDLPFAQARWCGAAGVGRIRALSDHREASFALNYGLLVKELRLLARAVVVLDRHGNVAYVDVVRELTQEPNYQAALDILAKLA